MAISGGLVGAGMPNNREIWLMRKIGLWLNPLLLLVGLVGVSFVLGKPTGAVNWSAIRAVALESDDWGLQGFVPDGAGWTGLDRESINPGAFPDVYWSSTLEDSSMVADLCAVVERFRGWDGLPAVFQPNYVMSAEGWIETGGEGRWRRFDLPDLDPRYSRPGLWNAVSNGTRAGVWYPEFHASLHYDPAMRRQTAQVNEGAAAATRRGIMLFPGGEQARELGDWRSIAELSVEYDHSLSLFFDLFGRWPGSVIAPDYTWSAKHEDLWASRGLRVIQGKREQRNPHWGAGLKGRMAKLWGRSAERMRHPDRVYLERNCRFEPVQFENPAAVVTSCIQETDRAWERGEPAIVETHRINFVHTDPAVVSTGLEALSEYLSALTSRSEALPVFLTDWEISQLQVAGTSWCVRAGGIVVRNGTNSRRVIVVPADAVALARKQAGLHSASTFPLLVAVERGHSIFVASDSTRI
jgi:hypothetical protein